MMPRWPRMSHEDTCPCPRRPRKSEGQFRDKKLSIDFDTFTPSDVSGQMNVQPTKYQGLVADLMPNIRLMQGVGHFLFRYVTGPIFIRKLYSWWNLTMILLQFFSIAANLVMNTGDVNELTANTITTLFFVHSVTKFVFFAVNAEGFYRTLGIWNNPNAHPLFAESDARYHSIALAKMRKLLVMVMTTTVLSVVAWITITFFGDSVKGVLDKETNETYIVEIPRLPIKAWYPWDAMSGAGYVFSFIYQAYFLLFSMCQANLADVLFCSWLLFACEQLQHLKGIMRPLMELSASLDTYRPNSAALFRAISAGSKSELILNEEKDPDSKDFDLSGIYSSKADWGAQFRAPSTLQTFENGMNGEKGNPNGLTRKQEMMVRSAIKYWVERHKHVVSSSVMEAAYSCHWYDGSEEAKTFVQIVCQQCQKAMTISGAKFFTVSLDLFASVLGAVVTYFMVLVQLK
uniref:Odorant receptor n=1 Tax=Culex quinquefasciatus TaxID=7176 RepID=A0A2C9MDB2_CULQU